MIVFNKLLLLLLLLLSLIIPGVNIFFARPLSSSQLCINYPGSSQQVTWLDQVNCDFIIGK